MRTRAAPRTSPRLARRRSPILLGAIALVALATPARAQTTSEPGWATVEVRGTISADLDLVQGTPTFGPGGGFSLIFGRPDGGDQELDVFSDQPLGEGVHDAPACGLAGTCTAAIFITPGPAEDGTLSNSGSGAMGMGNCTLTIDVIEEAGASGSFECAWTEIGVTATGEFDTTAGAGSSPGGGVDPGLLVLLGLGGATAAAATVTLARRRNRKRKPTDCSALEAEFRRAHAGWEQSNGELTSALGAAGLQAREQIPEYRARVDALGRAVAALEQQLPVADREATEAHQRARASQGRLTDPVERFIAAPGAEPAAEAAAYAAVESFSDEWRSLASRFSGWKQAILEGERAVAAFERRAAPTRYEGRDWERVATRVHEHLTSIEQQLRSLLAGSNPGYLGTTRAAVRDAWNGAMDGMSDLAPSVGEMETSHRMTASRMRAQHTDASSRLQTVEGADADEAARREYTHELWQRLVGPPCNKEEFRPMEPR